MKTVFMFSGQGSQYFQMGRELFEREPVFRDCLVRLDATARALCGNSVLEALYHDGHDKTAVFDRTLLTHPAIFMVEYALAQSLMRAGIEPDIALGASLGAFAAAAVAGAIDVEHALTAVIHQASALESCCEPGAMVAILAEPALFAEDFLNKHSELAGINFASHFVVSSKRIELAAIEAGLKRRDIVYQRLPVSFAFHSQWIDAAKAPVMASMQSIPRRTSRLPVMCCEQASTLFDLPDDYFWRVARHPIRFREAIASLEREGACRYIDVGPAGTLATFLKYGLSQSSMSTAHAVLTPFGRDMKHFTALAATGNG